MNRWEGRVVTTTERLTLRMFREDDLPLYAALNADPVVVEFLGGALSRQGSDEIAAYANDLWIRRGIGLLAVERTRDGTFLGMTYDHEADLDEHGDRFHAVIHAITRQRWIEGTESNTL